jgi:tyrosine-protein kinase Etk/Wzc
MQENSIAHRERTLLEGILYYLSYLLRHKYIIISITLLAAIGSVVFSIISLMLPPEKSPLPNYYQAYAVLIVGQGNGADAETMLASLGFDIPLGRDDLNYGELGIRVLQSRPFVDDIVEEHKIIDRHEIEEKLKSTSRRVVLNNSNFNYDARTGTLTIGYEDIDPEFAMNIVQSMVNKLQAWFKNWDGTSTQQELSAMKQKIEEVSAEITRLENEIQAFQSKYGVMSVDQLAQAQTAMITDLQTQLIQTEVAIKNYSGFSNIEDQELIQLRAQRESLQELIQQIERGQGTGGRQMPSREELPALAIEYSHLRMSHEIQMRIYQNLQEQYEVQKLATTGESVFSVLEPAEVPDEKSRPSRGELCMIVTLIGFFTSIALAILIDLIRNVKNDPEKRKILKGEYE